VLEIEIDNDEFVTGTLARSPQAVVSAAMSGLKKLLQHAELRPLERAEIRDLNGNTIGSVRILQT
jgi:hypothetical protein